MQYPKHNRRAKAARQRLSSANPPPTRRNLVLFMMDDVSRSTTPFYDGENRWPGSFPYPAMPWLNADVKPRALRYTQARVNNRCAPTRHAIFTGRQGHRSYQHPNGTGTGDVLGFTTTGQVPFYVGLTKEQKPWPIVAAGSGHRCAMFGKYHLFNYSQAGGTLTNRNNPRAVVDDCGFYESHEALLTNTSGSPGDPDWGYYSYPYVYTDRSTQTSANQPSSASGGDFSPALMYEKITTFIKEAVDAGKPFVVDYELNLPHGNWPQLAQTHELRDPFQTRNVQLHTTYTQAELVEDPAGNNGETGDGGYFADGTLDGSGTDPDAVYGPEGQVHVPWRRYLALMECVDRLTREIEEYIETRFPDEYANTTFMHYADNGGDLSVLNPLETTEHALLGANYANVFPPTSDGTTSGTQYHAFADAKGSTKDEGILTPLLVWGAAVPPALKGTDCDRYIGAADFYPTILDLIKAEWRVGYGSTSPLDGVTFADTFTSGSATGGPLYTSHLGFETGYSNGPSTPLDDYDFSVVGTADSPAAEGYKLRRWYEDGVQVETYELYDLAADPDESNDLYASALAAPASADGLALIELMGYHTTFFGNVTTK